MTKLSIAILQQKL